MIILGTWSYLYWSVCFFLLFLSSTDIFIQTTFAVRLSRLGPGCPLLNINTVRCASPRGPAVPLNAVGWALRLQFHRGPQKAWGVHSAEVLPRTHSCSGERPHFPILRGLISLLLGAGQTSDHIRATSGPHACTAFFLLELQVALVECGLCPYTKIHLLGTWSPCVVVLGGGRVNLWEVGPRRRVLGKGQKGPMTLGFLERLDRKGANPGLPFSVPASRGGHLPWPLHSHKSIYLHRGTLIRAEAMQAHALETPKLCAKEASFFFPSSLPLVFYYSEE